MTTSSPYCRSEMRPEYLAEFEAAGVPPYSQVRFPPPSYKAHRHEEAAQRPYLIASSAPADHEIQCEATRSRKVIFDAPGRYATSAVAANVAAIVLGVGIAFVVGFVIPMMLVFAFLRGVTKASRRGRRRSW